MICAGMGRANGEGSGGSDRLPGTVAEGREKGGSAGEKERASRRNGQRISGTGRRALRSLTQVGHSASL